MIFKRFSLHRKNPELYICEQKMLNRNAQLVQNVTLNL